MNNLYDILEVCLQDVENGIDLEKVLARYPEQADELSPILQASINARQMAVPEPSVDVVRRNRAKFLQHAAQIREAQTQSVKRSWYPFQNRLAVTFFLFIIFLYGGTGIVSAASDAIPGDVLYPVKRGWEGLSLSFTFDVNARDALASVQENERLREVDELFAQGLSARVDFTGVVTSQRNDTWRISQIAVMVSPQTQLPDGLIHVGLAVRVYGTTHSDNVVVAERIEYLPVNSALPGIVPIFEEPTTTPTPTNVATTTPDLEITPTPSLTATPKIESFEGILYSINKDVWTVNDIAVNVATAEIKGIPVVGARAKVEGYYRPDGVFVAIKIEIIAVGSSNNNSNSNGNDDSGANTNSNSDDNDDTNSNDNDNDNDNSGKDDNSNDDNNNNGG